MRGSADADLTIGGRVDTVTSLRIASRPRRSEGNAISLLLGASGRNGLAEASITLDGAGAGEP